MLTDAGLIPLANLSGHDGGLHSKKNSNEPDVDHSHARGDQSDDSDFKQIELDVGSLVEELISTTGWSIDHVLSMPVTQFFLMIQSQRKRKRSEMGETLKELARVAVCATGDPEYINQLQTHYEEWTMSQKQIEKRKNPRAFRSDDPVEATQAASIIADTLRQKAKIEGFRGG